MLIRFDALIQRRGINPFVAVSSARAEALTPGWRKPLPVLVRINDKPQVPWRINLMPAGTRSSICTSMKLSERHPVHPWAIAYPWISHLMTNIEAAPNIACRSGSNKNWTQIHRR